MTIDVIRLAKEAGIAPKPMILDGVEYEYQYVEFNDNIGGDEFGCIERFTALVVEECAKVVSETVEWKSKGWTSTICPITKGAIAEAIRARKPA